MYQKLSKDVIAAMKRKDEFALKVLRFVKSGVDSAAKDKLAPLTEDEVVRVLQKRIKQSQDAVEKYKLGGRVDLAQTEQREIDMIGQYLPAQLSADELGVIVKKVILETGATSMKEFGRVMGAVVKEAGTRSDGKSIKVAVEQALKG